jgi:hypothetical protein
MDNEKGKIEGISATRCCERDNKTKGDLLFPPLLSLFFPWLLQERTPVADAKKE